MQTLTTDIRQSIADIVNYDYATEEADYVREGEPTGHVFEHLKRVSDWLIAGNAAQRSVEILTDADHYGGACAWQSHPCIVVYGIPAWIMPNGYVRLGEPNAPMIEPDVAARTISDLARTRSR